MNQESAKWPDKIILIAEDEMINYMLLNKVLEGTQTKVLWAQNGQDAVQMTKDHHPDAILMDIRMPVMNGIEATKAIRSFDKDLPIIMVTAFTLDNEAEQCHQAGCSGFLTKPVRPVVLFEVLGRFFS
jgi:CheY-like chemotaxis protein